MRPRTEALIALGLLVVLAAIGALLGRSSGAAPDADRRTSTFLAGPEGARGLLEASRRLAIDVRRFRERPVNLAKLADRERRQALLILDPTFGFSAPEIGAVLEFARDADLVLAGEGAEGLMRCFGYQPERRFDSLRVASPGRVPGAGDPFVSRILVRTGIRDVVDSSRVEDVGTVSCRVPEVRDRETLLLTSREDIAAVRLTLENDREVFLFGDVAPFQNRNLRRTSAGPFVLGLLAGRYGGVIFEEYHHGFGPSGSLAGAAFHWSTTSPWGWAAWQLAVVGLLALLIGAVRFGPVRRVLTRKRRSPLEHVRALATALSAAGGHDEAIGAMVKGLRRRLAPTGVPSGGDWRAWLRRLDLSTASPRARAALTNLVSFTQPGQPARSVPSAAHAVEDLWQELKP
jgi:hypothetical protein